MHTQALRRRIAATTYRALYWARYSVAPGLRSLLGVLLMIGGVLGFLPVLGFWMLPLGVGFVALDLPMSRTHMEQWMARLAREAELTAVAAPDADSDHPTSSQ